MVAQSLDAEDLLDDLPCERANNRQFGTQASRVIRLVGINNRLPVGVRHCAAAQLIQVPSDIGDTLGRNSGECLRDTETGQTGYCCRDPRELLLFRRERNLKHAVEREEGVTGVVETAPLAHEAECEHRIAVGDFREIAQVELFADAQAAILKAAHRSRQIAAAHAAFHHEASLLDPRQHRQEAQQNLLALGHPLACRHHHRQSRVGAFGDRHDPDVNAAPSHLL